MAASFRQTALSAMTGDGWMLIWIILKVESDTFWLLWFSKILTEMPTKMGITFSFTFKLCHGGPPEAGLPLTPAHHTIWPLVRDNWINLAGLVSKYWACFKRYLCPHRGLFPKFIFIRCYLAKNPPSPTLLKVSNLFTVPASSTFYVSLLYKMFLGKFSPSTSKCP